MPKLGKIDLSQIECRLLTTWAREEAAVEKFRRGDDQYCETASIFYGRPITKADVAERGVGKQIILSCGYGAGASTIVRTARNGTYGPPVVLTLDQGLQLRDLYRGQHKKVCALWEQLSIAMFSLYAGTEMDLGPIQIGDRRIWAPGGLWMDFTSLKWDVKEKAWKHAVRGHERKTYGSRVVQNCVELMGRNLISTAMVAINRELKLKIPLTVHDDIVVVLPDDEEEAKFLLNEACKIVERVPDWMPELPLKVEAKIGENLE